MPKKQIQTKPNKVPVVETIAKAMIPAVLGVAALCAVTLAGIYFTRPAASSADTNSTQSFSKEPENENASENSNLNPAQQAAADKIKTDSPPPQVKQPAPQTPNPKPPEATLTVTNTPAGLPDKEVPETNQAANKQAVPPANPTNTNFPPPKSPPTIVAPASIGNARYKLAVAGGKLQFSQSGFDLGTEFPTIEKDAESGFEFLRFNGADQSLKLPDVPQSTGSVVVTARMNQSFAVVLHSLFGRILIRKGIGGLGWRVAGTSKIAPVREKNPFDEQQWHHIVMTWHDGGQAVLYRDGQAIDQFDYIHEVKRFSFFRDVTVCKTIFKNGADEDIRYFASDVHEVVVFDEQLSSNQVTTMYSEKKNQFGTLFPQ